MAKQLLSTALNSWTWSEFSGKGGKLLAMKRYATKLQKMFRNAGNWM